MKLTAIILLSACLTANAEGFGQTISLSERNIFLTEVFKKIEKQTDYTFAYTSSLLSQSKKVTLEINKGTLEQVLALCFKDQPFTYTIIEKTIVVKPKSASHEEQATITTPPPIDVKGRVVNEKGEPVIATIAIKGTKTATTTNDNGEFQLKEVDDKAILIITGVSIERFEVNVAGRGEILLNAKTKIVSLADVVVSTGYWQTSQRLNPGNIGKVTASEISKQPVSNPLAALQGRVPGLEITQTSGVPGSSFRVQIRGRSSIDPEFSKDDPLFIIDGVPFLYGNEFLNEFESAAGNPNMSIASESRGLSPLNLINPSDIESIEILKDADATAIYGSQGANGVILITTKKGKPGKTKVNLNVYSGFSKVTRTMAMLNTQQYLAMRREGKMNDTVALTNSNATDLLLWDTTRYTDFRKQFIGGTAHTYDANLSVSGGSGNTQFLVSGGYHRETTVYPGDMADQRLSMKLDLNHQSTNRKFTAAFSSMFSSDNNALSIEDLTGNIDLPPHMALLDSAGNLKWSEGGVRYFTTFPGFLHPLSYLFRKYELKSDNLINNLHVSYRFSENFLLKCNLGYNMTWVDEMTKRPKASIDPGSTALASAYFRNAIKKGWVVEPQFEYRTDLLKAKLIFLGGATLRNSNSKDNTLLGSNYSSDLLLGTIMGAGAITASDSYNQYRYAAFFSRINLNWFDRYILNLSGRRDGSSKFGDEHRISNFGAIGTAWVFSGEPFFKNAAKVINFGKLRASYGITGNDQIGNYLYLDSWNTTGAQYQGIPTLEPARLYNPNYAWEKNKKFEAGIDLGILNDKILFSLSYYRNRSGNKLVSYPLPIQTGFGSVLKNLEAEIQNSGFEIIVSTKNISSRNFQWETNFNITIPKSKLLSFPGLAISNYRNTYVVGQPFDVIYRVPFLGVDPLTGVYQFDDVNKDGVINDSDRIPLGKTSADFYGAFNNRISYKNLELDVFFEFRKQVGKNLLNNAGQPGLTPTNQPIVVLDRWQKPGDIAAFQRYVGKTGTPASLAASNNIPRSNAMFSDASFIRLKNISLSYTLPKTWLSKLKLEQWRLFVNAQNLLTITNYKGSDPESQIFTGLPPLKTIVGGLQITF